MSLVFVELYNVLHRQNQYLSDQNNSPKILKNDKKTELSYKVTKKFYKRNIKLSKNYSTSDLVEFISRAPRRTSWVFHQLNLKERTWSR